MCYYVELNVRVCPAIVAQNPYHLVLVNFRHWSRGNLENEVLMTDFYGLKHVGNI